MENENGAERRETTDVLVRMVDKLDLQQQDMLDFLRTLSGDVGSVKSDVSDLKSDVSTLKSDVRRVEGKVDDLAESVGTVLIEHEERFAALERKSP